MAIDVIQCNPAHCWEPVAGYDVMLVIDRGYIGYVVLNDLEEIDNRADEFLLHFAFDAKGTRVMVYLNASIPRSEGWLALWAILDNHIQWVLISTIVEMTTEEEIAQWQRHTNG